MSEDVPRYGASPSVDAQRVAELREIIAALGWSQRQAAEALEVDQRTLRYWAAANPAPPMMALYALRYLQDTHWSQRPTDPLTPEAIAEANRTGGHAAVDRLVERHRESDDDERVSLFQVPRSTI